MVPITDKQDEPIFVTEEEYASRNLDPDDVEMLRQVKAGEGMTVVSAEQFIALAEKAHAVYTKYHKGFSQVMGIQHAEYVRQLRVTERRSWRGVARACAEAWRGPWGSNQLAGMALCHVAAPFFDEDPEAEPWA